jgi:hypothetical protein
VVNKRLAMLAIGAMLALGLPPILVTPTPAAGRSRTTTKNYDVAVTCLATDGSGCCHPAFWAPVQGTRGLVVRFTASPAHCGAILVRFGYDNAFNGPNYVVGPGGGAAERVTGLGPGPHIAGVIAKPSGDAACPAGPLIAYEGTLTVTASKRAHR